MSAAIPWWRPETGEAEARIVREVLDSTGRTVYKHEDRTRPVDIPAAELALIQEGLRGVVKIPGGTAHWTLNGLCSANPEPKNGCPPEIIKAGPRL